MFICKTGAFLWDSVHSHVCSLQRLALRATYLPGVNGHGPFRSTELTFTNWGSCLRDLTVVQHCGLAHTNFSVNCSWTLGNSLFVSKVRTDDAGCQVRSIYSEFWKDLQPKLNFLCTGDTGQTRCIWNTWPAVQMNSNVLVLWGFEYFWLSKATWRHVSSSQTRTDLAGHYR